LKICKKLKSLAKKGKLVGKEKERGKGEMESKRKGE
jgi:hypothetical protein